MENSRDYIKDRLLSCDRLFGIHNRIQELNMEKSWLLGVRDGIELERLVK